MKEIKTCDNCRYTNSSIALEPCHSCIDIMTGERHNWEAPLGGTEGNNSDTKFTRCAVCKYRYRDIDEEPCNLCASVGRDDECKGEEVNCMDCKYAGVNMNEEPCKNCSKNRNNLHTLMELHFKPMVAHCYDCKHISKDVTESPCNECSEVSMGDDCKWEGVYCEDCKYVEVDVDAKPCNKCSNNDCISKETRATLSLCFEEPESKQEDEELQEEIASHDSKQEVYNGVTPSCWTCKHFEDNSNDAPCSKCVAICNGITSYWEERDEEIGLQTAREVVEKIAKQRLQEEHFDEHYHDKVQPLEIMQEIMTPEEFRGFLFGNIIKYSCRCGKKDEPQKEFAKLRRYKEWYDKAVLGEHIDPRV